MILQICVSLLIGTTTTKKIRRYPTAIGYIEVIRVDESTQHIKHVVHGRVVLERDTKSFIFDRAKGRYIIVELIDTAKVYGRCAVAYSFSGQRAWVAKSGSAVHTPDLPLYNGKYLVAENFHGPAGVHATLEQSLNEFSSQLINADTGETISSKYKSEIGKPLWMNDRYLLTSRVALELNPTTKAALSRSRIPVFLEFRSLPDLRVVKRIPMKYGPWGFEVTAVSPRLLQVVYKGFIDHSTWSDDGHIDPKSARRWRIEVPK